jgi:hypothetical protein
MVAEFNHDRLHQIDINWVRPYGFWTWKADNGRRGGMVCFRGDCRTGPDGEQDLRVIDFWMNEYYRASGGIDGLVVDTWEFGYWHDKLTFAPRIELPPTFRVLYSVLPHRWDDAKKLWGAAALRDNLDVALAEMDQYIGQLHD